MSTPNTEYATIVVSDTSSEKYEIRTASSDVLESETLSLYWRLFVKELRSGEIDPSVSYDPDGEGEAMVVFEHGKNGNLRMDHIFNPDATPHSGEASPAQALVYSAFLRIKRIIGPLAQHKRIA